MGIGGIIGSLGGISYDIVANDLTREGTDSAVENLKKVDTQSISTAANLAKVAAAFGALTALSAGAVAASDRVISLERETAQAAITQGVSTRAMYEYVQSLSNAADPQEEVGATMAYLSRTGLKMSDDLTSVYETMDKIGDATDQTSTAISQQLIPAFQALGLTSLDVAKYSDILTYSVQNSLFEISDWAMMIRRNGDALLQYNVPLEDTIAIMSAISALGVPSRQVMSLMNEAFKDMGANAKIAADGEKELLDIQTRLNEMQESGSRSARKYSEDMQNAGRDVGKMRSLTISYNRQKRDETEDRDKLLAEQAEIQARITAAKTAPQESLIEAAVKQRPEQLTIEGITKYVETSKTASIGETARRQPAGEIVTGSEIAAYNLDQTMQTVGKNITAEQAAGMVYLKDISGAMTAAVGILAVVQSLSAITATSTAITAASSAGGAGGLIAGAGTLGFGALAGSLLGGIGAGTAMGMGMEKSIRMQQAGAKQEWFRQRPGATEEDWKAYVYEQYTMENEENAPGFFQVSQTKAQSPESLTGENTGYSFADGGVVPGGMGEPVKAIVHGGETIIPAGKGGSGDYSVTIGTVNLTKAYDFPALMKDIETWQQTKRKQMGVRTS